MNPTPKDIVSELTYLNYRWNRINSISAERYKKILGDEVAAPLEARFREEIIDKILNDHDRL